MFKGITYLSFWELIKVHFPNFKSEVWERVNLEHLQNLNDLLFIATLSVFKQQWFIIPFGPNHLDGSDDGLASQKSTYMTNFKYNFTESTAACIQPTDPLSTSLNRMYLVAQSCPTLCDFMDCSLPGFPVHADCSGKYTWVSCHALLLEQGSLLIRLRLFHRLKLKMISHLNMHTHKNWLLKETWTKLSLITMIHPFLFIVTLIGKNKNTCYK